MIAGWGMTYEEVIRQMYARLPMFSRQGGAAYHPGLKNIEALCQQLENPHLKLKCIHVAGTNGKGSVSHWLASVLQSAGYKTGLYTSPHLQDFRERIRINGQMIDQVEVIRHYLALKEMAQDINASFFEVTVAMAFQCFHEHQVDWAIIETGMGGRLDSTNVVQPVMSVITNIGMDHQQFLGDTLPAIAAEKAGIIKGKCPVLVGRFQDETHPVFSKQALEKEAPLLYAADWVDSVTPVSPMEWEVKRCNGSAFSFNNPLNAIYQSENVATVVAAVDWLNQDFFFNHIITDQQLILGLEKVIEQTGFRGRWQTLKAIPKVVADVGHNSDGMSAVARQLAMEDFDELHIVVGMVKDKDVAAALEHLPRNAHYYICEPPLERKMPAFELARHVQALGVTNITTIPSPGLAYQTALYQAADNDLILIIGSFFIVGEVL